MKAWLGRAASRKPRWSMTPTPAGGSVSGVVAVMIIAQQLDGSLNEVVL